MKARRVLAGLALAGLGIAGLAAAAAWWPRGEAKAQAVEQAAEQAVEPGLLPYRDAAAVARGRAIYDDYCAACHGAALEGQPNWRERDAEGYLPAPPHDATGHTWHHPDSQLVAITWLGTERVVGQGYRSRMQGYEGILSETQVLEVLAYIKSTWPEEIIARHNQINAEAARN